MQYPSFLLSFLFLICLSGRRMVFGSQGTFLSPEEKGHGTLGRLLRGLLSSGSQLCLHELAVSLLVEAVGWGSPILAVMGVSLGHPETFCVCWEQWAFSDSSNPQSGARGRVAGRPVLGAACVAWLCPALPLNRHWVSASLFTSGISIPLSKSGEASAFLR